MSTSVTRYHDISCGHRVVGHEGKCQFMHGHNYRIHFVCETETNELDILGRVIDFGEIKSKLCMWLENNWDHKFIYYIEDPVIDAIRRTSEYTAHEDLIIQSFVPVSFNPTAENMARYLVEIVGPRQLKGTGVKLVKCIIEETSKCSATFELDN